MWNWLCVKSWHLTSSCSLFFYSLHTMISLQSELCKMKPICWLNFCILPYACVEWRNRHVRVWKTKVGKYPSKSSNATWTEHWNGITSSVYVCMVIINQIIILCKHYIIYYHKAFDPFLFLSVYHILVQLHTKSKGFWWKLSHRYTILVKTNCFDLFARTRIELMNFRNLVCGLSLAEISHCVLKNIRLIARKLS